MRSHFVGCSIDALHRHWQIVMATDHYGNGSRYLNHKDEQHQLLDVLVLDVLGLVRPRDASDANQLHVYLMSYERITVAACARLRATGLQSQALQRQNGLSSVAIAIGSTSGFVMGPPYCLQIPIDEII